MVTIKDVADELNCSPTTISLILNNHPLAKRMAATTRNRVLEAVKRMGYVPNAHAKLLRQSNMHSIGILCSNINDPYCTEILKGIMEHLNQQDCFFRLLDMQDNEASMESFIRVVRSYNIEAIISVNNALAINPLIIEQFVQSDIPLISIGRKNAQYAIPYILLDNELGIKLGIDHLAELGHREIGFILGPEEIEDSLVRWKAIQKICKQLKISCQPNRVERITDALPTAESGATAIRRLHKKAPSLTAVFAFDDATAYGVILELTRMGISVPRDISVIGFDDIWPSRSYNPPLTTIRQPLYQMGQESARIMVSTLNKRKATRETVKNDVVFKPELVIRETTIAPPNAPAPKVRGTRPKQSVSI